MDRFGADKTAQIVTYGQEKMKSGINDLVRTYGLNQVDEEGNKTDIGKEINKIIPAKMPDQNDPTYGTLMALADDPERFRDDYRDATEKMHEVGKQFKAYMEQYPQIDEGLQFIEGLIRNYGIHAAAVVITNEPITDHIPVYKSTGILPVTAFNMKEVDDELQMLKLDVLSLATVRTIYKTVQFINNQLKREGKPLFDIRKIDYNDQDAIKTIRDGYTVGVFQMASNGITQYTKQARPQTFKDIVDIAAIYRPGPLEAEVEKGVTMAEKYVQNADPESLRAFLAGVPETLLPIYTSTRGVLIYQEQILAIAQVMAGYTLGGADLLRRAVGKKDQALIDAVRAEFVYGTDKAIPILTQMIADEKQSAHMDEKKLGTYEKELKSLKSKTVKVPGAIARGYSEEYSNQTYDAIRRFSGYGFNLAHSSAYALLALRTAYLKTHFPVEFMAAQLSVEGENKEDTLINMAEARRLNIEILPPDINKSHAGYSIEWVPELDEEGNATGYEKKAIRFGLLSIAGIGQSVVDELMTFPPRDDEPESAGEPYKNFDDFFHRVNKRVINKSKIEALIQAGAFDFDISNRYVLLNHFYFNLRGDKQFEGSVTEYEKAKKAKKVKAGYVPKWDVSEFDEDVISEWEQELFGFYLTHHPFADLPYVSFDEVNTGFPMEVGGKITAIKLIKTQGRGEKMAFVTLETAGGKIDVTVFPRTFNENIAELFKGNIIIVVGKKDINKRDGKPCLIMDKVKKPRKKKFRVEKPPELEELAKRGAGKPKVSLEDLGGPVVKDESEGQMDLLAGLFDETGS